MKYVTFGTLYFSFQPVFHDWCNKEYPICGMVHIRSSPCSSISGFHLSLSEWSFTICPAPYNRKYNVLIASLNKTIPTYLPLYDILFTCHASMIPLFEEGDVDSW